MTSPAQMSAAAAAGTVVPSKKPDAAAFVLAAGEEMQLKEDFTHYLRYVICRQMKRTVAASIRTALGDQKAADALQPHAKLMLAGAVSFSQELARFNARIDESELMNKSKSGFEIQKRRQFMNAIGSATRIALEKVPDSAPEPMCPTTQQTTLSELKYVAVTNRNGQRAARWMDQSLVQVARLMLFLITIDYRVEIAVDSEISVKAVTFDQLLLDSRNDKSRFGLLFQDWIRCRRHLVRILGLETAHVPKDFKVEVYPARLPWVLPASLTCAQMLSAVELSIMPDLIGSEVVSFPFVTHGDVKERRLRREQEIERLLLLYAKPGEVSAPPPDMRELMSWFRGNTKFMMRLFQLYLQLENGAPRNVANDSKNLEFAKKHYTGNIGVCADILKKLTLTSIADS